MKENAMLKTLVSCAVLGLQTHLIEVEVDTSKGEPNMCIVGLGDAAVQEAKLRIKLALKNSKLPFPYTRRIVINLAPANLKKEGASFDMAMALGILLGQEQIRCDTSKSLFVGELALDGSFRPTTGTLPILLFAKELGITDVYVPAVNSAEAVLVTGLRIYPVQTIRQLFEHMCGRKQIEIFNKQHTPAISHGPLAVDMADIHGQQQAKRALEIAASGGHNVLFSGPPGSGKTLLAKAFPSILPRMTRDEILEVSKIYSVVGLLPADSAVVEQRPFRAPHHSASAVSLVGGGRFPRPGEITLAHRGVLFLDEFPEFPRTVIEVLRQPLEDGVISISRAAGSLLFPARFTLIASMNPCPCGYMSDQDKSCACTPHQIGRYQQKISGPILDRIDLHVSVPRLPFEDLRQDARTNEHSSVVQQRVQAAREIQTKRFEQRGITMNAEMGSRDMGRYCAVSESAVMLLRQAMRQMQFSGRAYHRILKVARTIADLDSEALIDDRHIAEALQFRSAS